MNNPHTRRSGRMENTENANNGKKECQNENVRGINVTTSGRTKPHKKNRNVVAARPARQKIACNNAPNKSAKSEIR